MNDSKHTNNLEQDIINSEKQQGTSHRGSVNKRVGVVAVILAALCIFAWVYTAVISIIPEDKQIQYTPTTMSISTYTDNLEYKPVYISTDLGKRTATFNIDLSDSIVVALNNSIGNSYILYTGDDLKIKTEIIITSTIPINLGFKEDVDKALEKNKNKLVVLEDADGITTERAVTKLYDLGYLVVIQTTESMDINLFASEMIDTIKDCMLYSDNKKITQQEKMMLIEIEGLGNFDFNTIAAFKNNVAVRTEDNGTLKLYNGSNNTEYIIFEEYDKSYSFSLVEDWNNLYREKDSGKLGIQTSKGFYVIETSSEEIEGQLISLIGIQKEDDKIQTIF